MRNTSRRVPLSAKLSISNLHCLFTLLFIFFTPMYLFLLPIHVALADSDQAPAALGETRPAWWWRSWVPARRSDRHSGRRGSGLYKWILLPAEEEQDQT